MEVGEALAVEEASRGLLSRAVGARGEQVRGTELQAVDHVFTHFRATYRAFVFAPEEPILEDAPVTGRWIHVDGLDTVALPVAQRKIWTGARQFLQREHIPAGPAPDPPGDRFNGRITE